MKQKTEITFEVEETILLRQEGGKILPAFCPQCQALVEMAAPHTVAALSDFSEREIFRLVEADKIHFVETDCLLICLNCLLSNNRIIKDFGLGAEDVAKLEPLLVTDKDKGEGVKYDRVGVVLINAVKEQQAQIESQQKQLNEQKDLIKNQQTEITALEALVCAQNQTAALCQPKN